MNKNVKEEQTYILVFIIMVSYDSQKFLKNSKYVFSKTVKICTYKAILSTYLSTFQRELSLAKISGYLLITPCISKIM